MQLRRAKGWRLPEGAVSVAYPTRWANPYRRVRPRSQAVALYREHLLRQPDLVEDAARELAGKDLACWCPLDQPCHADVLLEIAASIEQVAERWIRRGLFKVIDGGEQ